MTARSRMTMLVVLVFALVLGALPMDAQAVIHAQSYPSPLPIPVEP